MEHLIRYSTEEDIFEKAVQLYIRELLFLATARFRHGSIVDLVLESMGIPFETTELDDYKFSAKREGELYRVAGAGDIYIKDQRIVLSGNSHGYGIPICKKHVEDIRPFLPSYNISVRTDQP